MKKSIKVISQEMGLLGEIDLYSSLIFNKEYDDADGGFQITLGVTAKNVELLTRGNLIMVNNNRNRVGIIRHSQIDLNDEGKEVLMIKGYSVENILNHRKAFISTTERETIFVGNSATLIENLINDNFINPTNLDRKVEALVSNIDKSLGTNIIWKIDSGNSVGDIISEICRLNELGYKIELDMDSRKLVFKLYKGEDLSNSIVFDPDLDNITNMRLISSDLDYRNTLYLQHSTKEIGVITEHNSDSSKGLNRIEGFASAKSLREEESIDDVATQYFRGNELVESIEGDIKSTSLFTYGRDFNLGDVVTVRNKVWDVSKKLRVTAVVDVHESNPKTSFIFGEPRPTLAHKIKNYITNMQKEG